MLNSIATCALIFGVAIPALSDYVSKVDLKPKAVSAVVVEDTRTIIRLDNHQEILCDLNNNCELRF